MEGSGKNELKKIITVLSQVVNLCSSQDSNLVLPKYKSQMLLIEPASSVTTCVTHMFVLKLSFHKFSTYVVHF